MVTPRRVSPNSRLLRVFGHFHTSVSPRIFGNGPLAPAKPPLLPAASIPPLSKRTPPCAHQPLRRNQSLYRFTSTRREAPSWRWCRASRTPSTPARLCPARPSRRPSRTASGGRLPPRRLGRWAPRGRSSAESCPWPRGPRGLCARPWCRCWCDSWRARGASFPVSGHGFGSCCFASAWRGKERVCSRVPQTFRGALETCCASSIFRFLLEPRRKEQIDSGFFPPTRVYLLPHRSVRALSFSATALCNNSCFTRKRVGRCRVRNPTESKPPRSTLTSQRTS